MCSRQVQVICGIASESMFNKIMEYVWGGGGGGEFGN